MDGFLSIHIIASQNRRKILWQNFQKVYQSLSLFLGQPNLCGMCIVCSCSENWRTNIKFSRLTLYFYIPGHTWTDWKIGANHIFQKYKLDRKLLREIEGYFSVKLIVCLLRWCLLRIVTLPSWMRSTVEMFLAKIYISVPVFGLFTKAFTYFQNFRCQYSQ